MQHNYASINFEPISFTPSQDPPLPALGVKVKVSREKLVFLKAYPDWLYWPPSLTD